MAYLGRGGLLQRITPSHYNLYDENRQVGSVHRSGGEPEGWYGVTHPSLFEGRAPLVTGTHPTKHHAGHDLMGKVWEAEHEGQEDDERTEQTIAAGERRYAQSLLGEEYHERR